MREVPDGREARTSILIRARRPAVLRPSQRLTRASVVGVTAVAAYALPKALLALEGPPICVFRHVTGLPCPLCGGTHAMSHLMDLDVAQAIEANTGVTILAVGAGIWAVASLWEAVSGRTMLGAELALRLKRAAPMSGALVLLVAWATRWVGVS